MASTHLTTPAWSGKALGTAAALVFAPPEPAALLWWLAAGIALGHGLDSVGHQFTRRANRRPQMRQESSQASLRFTFAALGRIAAASGDVGPHHRRYAERLMARLAFTPERRREALVWFHAGRDSAFPFDSLAAACRRDFAEHAVLKDLAIQSLCRMTALSDTPKATAELLTLGEKLGWDRAALAAQAVAMAALIPAGGPIEQARETLGVGADDSPEVIRLAYRRRVARWHPDRLPPEASAEERTAAEERMWRLRDALELLTADPDAR